jgi:hypothetical protein
MTPGVLGKIFLWWLGLLLLAVLNGTLREQFLVPQLGSTVGLACSGLLLCTLVLGVACLAAPPLHYKGVNLWVVGALWLILTLSFEFTFAALIQHQPLVEVLQAYTFKGGNLWLLVVLMIFVGPRLAAVIRDLH